MNKYDISFEGKRVKVSLNDLYDFNSFTQEFSINEIDSFIFQLIQARNDYNYENHVRDKMIMYNEINS